MLKNVAEVNTCMYYEALLSVGQSVMSVNIKKVVCLVMVMDNNVRFLKL